MKQTKVLQGSAPQWIWHTVERHSGYVLAYIFGSRTDAVLKERRKLLEPFWIVALFTDDWAAYHRVPMATEHHAGKHNTHCIAHKHLTWRTRIKRLARKTIGFSKRCTIPFLAYASHP
ncbi:IS1 family transposase [Magnetococcus sp. PR-3]|uniref:IS1 family transposase n=1 Tax=Magnetococcus sp. PR-3 TaxID=3120355 RepID=UPI003FA56B70